MTDKNKKKGIVHPIWHFFDKFEDHNRSVLSHYPIAYAIIGGFGIVQYWRGVWHLSDEWGWSSITSIVVGLVVLLASGLLVSFFIGDNIVLTGLRKEKKLVEKTEEEIRLEEEQVLDIQAHIKKIESSLDEIKQKVADSANKNENYHT